MKPLMAVIVFAAALSPADNIAQPNEAPFHVVEASIPEMQRAMSEGRITSRQIVEQYLVRIALYNDKLNALITVNPQALAEADRLDQERRSGKVRGRLHGIPIALKDNIHTTDMRTTGGAIAFESLMPPYDATLTTNLREAGAVLLAKTTLTELGNFVANGMPGNYNAIQGHGMNPYDPRRDPRPGTSDGRPVLNTGVSSSGAGTAANFWAANVGTETSGSLLIPATQNMLVAIKPTMGRISRYGVIPISIVQDTPGPMAKTVTDATILLGALESAAPDGNDPATTTCQAPPNRDYTPHLKRDGLKGARVGIPRASYYDRFTPPGEKEPRGGLNESQAKLMADAIEVLKREGATVVDADLPSVVSQDPKNNALLWGAGCSRGPSDPNCSSVLWYSMKRDFNAWLASLGPAAPVKTLTELRAFNAAHSSRNAIKYGQSQLDRSDVLDLERDRAKYQADRKRDIRLAGTEGIDAALKAHKLDALLFPGPSGAVIAAKPGYPTVIVPIGLFVPGPPANPYPAGFTLQPAPYGVSFTGTTCSEPRLIELAYAFEQATMRRVPPASTP
jgi:amidase